MHTYKADHLINHHPRTIYHKFPEYAGYYFLRVLMFDIMQNFVPANIGYMHYGALCQPCTPSAYKSQNLVLAKRVLAKIAKKMYLQIIVTLR
jgi:hypothetical protein